MKINQYFTADWHIGHENVLKFCDRPFRDVHHMHRVLIKRYNSTVRQNDVCWFLGDVGMTNVEQMKKVLDQLNGKKILVLGNHDRGMNAMYALGFHAVMHTASIMIMKESVKALDRQYDVGVDANNYMPVSMGTLESWITRTKRKK